MKAAVAVKTGEEAEYPKSNTSPTALEVDTAFALAQVSVRLLLDWAVAVRVVMTVGVTSAGVTKAYAAALELVI